MGCPQDISTQQAQFVAAPRRVPLLPDGFLRNNPAPFRPFHQAGAYADGNGFQHGGTAVAGDGLVDR